MTISQRADPDNIMGKILTMLQIRDLDNTTQERSSRYHREEILTISQSRNPGNVTKKRSS